MSQSNDTTAVFSYSGHDPISHQGGKRSGDASAVGVAMLSGGGGDSLMQQAGGKEHVRNSDAKKNQEKDVESDIQQKSAAAAVALPASKEHEKHSPNSGKAPVPTPQKKAAPPVPQGTKKLVSKQPLPSPSGGKKLSPKSAPNPSPQSSVPTAKDTAPMDDADLDSDASDTIEYILKAVKSTEEAIAQLREMQTRRKRENRNLNGKASAPGAKKGTLGQPNMGGRGHSSSSTTDIDAMSQGAASLSSATKTPSTATPSGASKAPQMEGELPATLHEFLHCHSYTVSLVADREAVFSDALSGFAGYVQREESELAAFRERHAKQQALLRKKVKYIRTYSTHGGVPCVSAEPVEEDDEDDDLFAPGAAATREAAAALPASAMFLMRSRDEAQLLEAGALGPSARAPMQPSPSASVTESPSAANSPEAQERRAQELKQKARLQELRFHAYLQEKAFQRSRVPVVFKYLYAPDIDNSHDPIPADVARAMSRQKQRDERRSSGSTNMNSRLGRASGSSSRFQEQNSVRKEWPFVWEQFTRDINREVLFIEGTPYFNAEDALAAIHSYLDYCYSRGQAAAAKRKEEEHRKKEEENKGKGFFQSLLASGALALREAVVQQARDTLPTFVGDSVLSAAGLDPVAFRNCPTYPTDPIERSTKIFEAVRLVVLASQQSFMGFPYQLLCEQVGTERLALALESVWEEDDEEDDAGDESAATLESDMALLLDVTGEESTTLPLRQLSDMSEDGDACGERPRLNMTVGSNPSCSLMWRMPSGVHSTPGSPIVHSKVLKIYRGSHNARRKPCTDDWNCVSRSSSSSSSTRSEIGEESARKANKGEGQIAEKPRKTISETSADVKKGAPEEIKAGTPKRVSAEVHKAAKAMIRQEDAAAAAAAKADRRVTSSSALPLRALAQPSLDTSQGHTEHQQHHHNLRHKKDDLHRRRKRRERSMPLLVGEPRMPEFNALVALIRERVHAKIRREEKQRIKRAEVAAQREAKEKAKGLSQTTKPVDSGDTAPATSRPVLSVGVNLFRPDVDGSVYLMPVINPLSSPTMPSGDAGKPEAAVQEDTQAQKEKGAAPEGGGEPDRRGMRIQLYYDEKRNVPLVCVNKIFRLFIVPGLESFSSFDELACPKWHAELDEPRNGAVEEKKSLLLLIQIQFPLFTGEQAEVRWRWWAL